MDAARAAAPRAAAGDAQDISGDSPVTAPVFPGAPARGADPDVAASVKPDTGVLDVPDAGALPTETVGVVGELALDQVSPVDRVEVAQPSTAEVAQARAADAADPLPGVDGEAAARVDGTAKGTDGLATLGDEIRVESLGELPVDAVDPAGSGVPDVWGLRLSRDSADLDGSGLARVKVSYEGLTAGLGGDY